MSKTHPWVLAMYLLDLSLHVLFIPALCPLLKLPPCGITAWSSIICAAQQFVEGKNKIK